MLQCQYLFSLKVALPLCNKQDRFMLCYCMPVLSTNWLSVGDLETWWYILASFMELFTIGDVAQMVERSLSMWEVGGSIPPVSKTFTSLHYWSILPFQQNVTICINSGYVQPLKFSKRSCIDRESNPGRPRGRRAFYHWTIDAQHTWADCLMRVYGPNLCPPKASTLKFWLTM